MTVGTAALVILLSASPGQRGSAGRAADDISRDSLILTIEDTGDSSPAELKLLIDTARGQQGARDVTETQALAIRALGRLERPDAIPVLLELVRQEKTRTPAASALLLTLRAVAPQSADAGVTAAVDALLELAPSATVLTHLPYTREDQVELAEAKLMARASDPKAYASIAGGLEVLARKHGRLHPLKAETVRFLERGAERSLPLMDPTDNSTPRMSLAALAASGRADKAILSAGLRDRDDQVRRIAMLAANSAGAPIDATARAKLIGEALRDSSHFVRLEALRGWSRREAAAQGCAPLVEALSDRNQHVVLAALDALGERCLDDDAITDRLAAEARTPPTIGEWQREAHAFLALARRSPERAATTMPAFISHDVWQVRLYAARAAAAMKDVVSLERLAYDVHDNVREATLAPLRALQQSDSDAAFIAALGRSDYQLLRTAALALKGAVPTKYLLGALVAALERVTDEKRDTSRDTRLALLDRVRAFGGRDQLTFYERLLKDFDPRIAAMAAEACTSLSTRPCVPDPRRRVRAAVSAEAVRARVKAVIHLDNGRSFDLYFARDLAPLSTGRFLRLARAHYYDGLTFHRVEPSFVIQGGSPGANEYVGDGPFMRDELGGSHRRGTIGISTRGRHTGDAQIFVNLVDNPRLDLEYTAFAWVPDEQMPTVDAVQEGTRIVRIDVMPSPR